jgi:hypothetical protein
MLPSIPAFKSALGTSAIDRSNALTKRTTKYAIAVAAGAVLFGSLATVGSAPASAQSFSHYGSPLPRYYDADGAQHWGSWAPSTTNQTRTLYLDVKPTRRHALRKVR